MRICTRFIVIASLMFGLSAWGYAGSSPSSETGESHSGQAFVFFAPGAEKSDGYSMGTAHFGGGGEGFIYRGLGAGAEIGYLTPWEDFSAGIGMLSVNGSYHFNRNRKLSPFISGGYSLGFRSGHINMYNFGGGINYWFHDRIGLRLEFRDHVWSRYTPVTHYIGGRIGLSFR